MRIQFKLALVVFAVIAISVVVAGFAALGAFQKISRDMDFIFMSVDMADSAVSDLIIASGKEVRVIEEYAGDFLTPEEAEGEIEELAEIIGSGFEKLSGVSSADLIAQEDINKLQTLFERKDELRKEIFRLKSIAGLQKISTGGELREKLEEFDAVAEETGAIMDDAKATILFLKEAQKKDFASSVTLTIRKTFAIEVITAVFLALSVGTFISLFLIRPLRMIQEDAESIVAGDLTRRAEVRSKDEIGRLAKSFNRMTERLLEARDLPENILVSMKDGLFVVDTNGNITDVNKAALDLLGYKKEELVGRPLSKVLVKNGGSSEAI